MRSQGASTPIVRFVQQKRAEQENVQPARANTPGPNMTTHSILKDKDKHQQQNTSDVINISSSTIHSSPQKKHKSSVSYAHSSTSSTTTTNSVTAANNIRSKITLARQNREAAVGLVQGTKELDKRVVKGAKVFVRCADDITIQPWPLNRAIANVAAITGDMEMMQRHGLLDPGTDQHPLFSLEQMQRLYEAQCADNARAPTDERLARFCETLGNFACGEQFIMRECKFESYSINAICGIIREGGPPASISHLDLSGNNLGADGGRLLAQTLPCLKDLCVLRLGSANLGDGISAIAAALRDNQNVTHFDLSATHCGAHRNSILGDTVRVMCTMLRRNRVLAHINLSNTSLKSNGPILMESMALCRSLVHIGLRDNGLGHECAEPLAKMVSQLRVLETLDLAENNLTGASIELLCHALCTRKVDRAAIVAGSAMLKTLDLSKNKIDAAVDSAVEALCNAIETLGVKRLVLSDNNLCRSGYDPLEGTRLPPTTDLVARIFTSASKLSSGVEWLEMANCGCTDLPRCIIDLMVAPSTLTRLDLSRNNLKDKGAVVLAEGLANTESNLTFLDISNNGMTTAGAKLIARALRTNRSLRNLKCCNGARMDEERSGLVEAICGHKKLETVDLQKACMHDVRATLERNRKQRSVDSVPQSVETKEKTTEIARQVADLKDQGKEERHRLEHQLDVLKIMRERAKSTNDSQKETINQLTNEAIEWRANYEELLTRHKELHEEILSKQQKLNRQLEDATRKSDKEHADKNAILSDSWLIITEFEIQNFTRCQIDQPCLPAPGNIRSRMEEMRKRNLPEDDEIVLEKELEKLLAQNKDQKSTCEMYHNKLLELGVHEEDIQDCFPEEHPESLKRRREEKAKKQAETEARMAQLELDRLAAEKAEAEKKEAELNANNRRGGRRGLPTPVPKPSGKKPSGKKKPTSGSAKPVRAGGK